jgi:alpha-tubulin suppressor-like RCC1 family protein
MATQELPVELLTHVCQQLGLRDLVRVSATCKRCRHGGLETVELPTESSVVMVLRALAFPCPELIPNMRSDGYSESWVAYLARCARQRRCREAPTISTACGHTLFVDPTGRLLVCGKGAAVGHGDDHGVFSAPRPVAAMDRVRSVAAAYLNSLALGWDGRVYSWGKTWTGQLGRKDKSIRRSPVLVEGLEGVRGIAAGSDHSLAVMQSGDVFHLGESLLFDEEYKFRTRIVDGFGGVRVRSVCAGEKTAFAIGEEGEVFSWGCGDNGCLGHGDTQNQPSPKRVKALRGNCVSSVSVAFYHTLALREDGLMCAWGENRERTLLGNPDVERELLPKPVEALRSVRVSSIVSDQERSYVVADTGEVWAWGSDGQSAPLGHGEQIHRPVPKRMKSLRGVKVDAVAAGSQHTLALADDGSVYAWGSANAAASGALGLGPLVQAAGRAVPTPQRIPALRVACGL